MNEDNKELEFLANRILLGKYIFIYENKRYYQTIPTLDIKVSADFLYEQTYEENVFNDNFFSLTNFHIASSKFISSIYIKKYCYIKTYF